MKGLEPPLSHVSKAWAFCNQLNYMAKFYRRFFVPSKVKKESLRDSPLVLVLPTPVEGFFQIPYTPMSKVSQGL